MTKPNNPPLDPLELARAVYYDPKTGIFSRRDGKPIGRKNEKGYLSFNVLKHAVKAHRLAWFYCYGRWPRDQIDHINGDPSDNRIENLREVAEWQNHVNFHRRRICATGFLGVREVWGRYRGVVKANKRAYYTKLYRTPEEAAAARRELALRHQGVFAK